MVAFPSFDWNLTWRHSCETHVTLLMWGSRDVTHVRLTRRHLCEVKSLMLGSRDVTYVRLTWRHSCKVKSLMLVSRDVTHVRLTWRYSCEVIYDYYNILAYSEIFSVVGLFFKLRCVSFTYRLHIRSTVMGLHECTNLRSYHCQRKTCTQHQLLFGM